MSALRAIVHCDLDCFYAQVERERLKLPMDTPLAVLQWDSALAVSYPARAYGIKRGASLADIRRLAGDAVTVVHVETISAPNPHGDATLPGDTSQQQQQQKSEQSSKLEQADEKNQGDCDNDCEDDSAGKATGNVADTGGDSHNSNVVSNNSDEYINNNSEANQSNQNHMDKFNPQRDNEKVSLARYREASARVFSALSTALHGLNAVVERASIDEAYIDLSVEADRRLRAASGGACPLPQGIEIEGGGDNDSNQMLALCDARLTHAAAVAADIRAAVRESCNFTISAGVASNKLLAKLSSARHKPDALSLTPHAAVVPLLVTLPARSLRGLGGKLGARVEALVQRTTNKAGVVGVAATATGSAATEVSEEPSAVTAADVARLGLATLQRALGDRDGRYVFDAASGRDESAVVVRGPPKSLLAAKSFAPTDSLRDVESKWLPVLASELGGRLADDAAEHERVATTLTVSFRAVPVGPEPPASRGAGAGRMSGVGTSAGSTSDTRGTSAITSIKTPTTTPGKTASKAIGRTTSTTGANNGVLSSVVPPSGITELAAPGKSAREGQGINENLSHARPRRPRAVMASRSMPMPSIAGARGGQISAGANANTNARAAQALQSAAVTVLRQAFGGARPQWSFPLSFVGLTAGKFVKRASANEGIARFFVAKTNVRSQGELVSLRDNAGAKGATSSGTNASTNASSTVGVNAAPGDNANTTTNANQSATAGESAKVWKSAFAKANTTSSSAESAAERHRRRVQERADRELALRLHRQEALGVGRKTTGGSGSGSGSGGSSKRRGSGGDSGDGEEGRIGKARGKVKRRSGDGVRTKGIDSFFKPKTKTVAKK